VLGTLGTILKWVILLPVLLAVVLLAVANDQTVTLHLNPFDKADPVLKVDLALYQVMFLIFVIGVLIGGLVAWSSAARRRRRRGQREDTALWQARTEWSEQRRAEPAESRASAFLPRPERG
jgi:heme/copper-type cytochrome/quinol oxidase subunit 2